MAENIRLPSDVSNTGKRIHVLGHDDNGTTIYDHANSTSDPLTNEIGRVINYDPTSVIGSGLGGIVTRNIPFGIQSVSGVLTHNSAAPVSNNLGVLSAFASSTSLSLTDGRQVLLRTTLAGDLVVSLDGETVILGTGANTIGNVNLNTNYNPIGFVSGAINQGTGGNSAWKVDGSAVTQPISGTVISNAGTGTFVIGDGGSSITVDGTVAATQSGSWSISGPVTAIQPSASALNTNANVSGVITLGAGSASVGTVSLNTGANTIGTVNLNTNYNPVGFVSGVISLGTGSATIGSVSNITGTVSLPTGAATSALQTQPGVDIGDVTINNAAGASAVNIQDGGNSITIDGSVNITGTPTVNVTSATVNYGEGVFAVSGIKTNNNAAPGATNIGALSAIANASAPSYSEGNLVLQRVNLAGDTAITLDGEAVVLGAGVANIGSVVNATGYNAIGFVSGTIDIKAGAASIGTVGLNTGANTIGSVDLNTNYNPVGFISGVVTLGAGSSVIGKLSSNSGVDIGDVTIDNASGGSAVNIQDGGNSLTIDGNVSITGSLPTGSNNIGSVNVSSATVNYGNGVFAVSGIKTNNSAAPGATNIGTLPAIANASAPSYSEGNQVSLSMDLAGALRVSGASGGGVAQTQIRDLTNTWVDVGLSSSHARMPVTIHYGTGITAISGVLTNNNAAPTPSNLGVLSAIANAATPSYSEGNQVLLRTNLGGDLIVSGVFNGYNLGVSSLPALSAGTNNIGDVDILSIAGGDNNIGNVDIATQPARSHVTDSIRIGDGTDLLLISATGAALVDGSAVTQPISGSVSINGTPTVNVSSATVNYGYGVFAVSGIKTNNTSASDATNIGALTSIANASAPSYSEGNQVSLRSNLSGDLITSGVFRGYDVVLGTGLATIGSISNISGTVSLPTGASTAANQSTANSSLSSIDSKITAVNTGAVVVSSSALPTGAATSALQTQPGVDIGDITINNAGAGSAVNIQDGGNAITVDGSVDIASLPNEGQQTMANSISVAIASDQSTVAVTAAQATASSLNAQVVGSIAHDGIDSGNPVKIGAKALSTIPSVVATGDRTDAISDLYGALRVREDHVNQWSYHENSSSALTDTTVKAAPGAGLSIYITDIVCSTGAATAMDFFIEEGTTTIVLGPYYLEAIAGRGVALQFKTPKKITANTLISITNSAAIAHSFDISGFIAP